MARALVFYYHEDSPIILMIFFWLFPYSNKEDQFCPPCGRCRQVIAEFGYSNNCLVLLVKPSGEYKETTIKDLLPEAFTGKDLLQPRVTY